MIIEFQPSGLRTDGGDGEVVILGVGVFRNGERLKGRRKDLQPLVDAGHAREVLPGEKIEPESDEPEPEEADLSEDDDG